MTTIDPARRRRIETICDDALQRDGAERVAFVAAACAGDEALRRDVESLLGYAPSAGRFLDGPVGALAAHVMSGSDTAGSWIGRRIGGYEVVGWLGAGGMGEVYRARDTRLGRDVAIKVLPTAFTSDVDRRTRFEREARVLAAFNHPHIGAIYGVEVVGDVSALVLELVEGDTLAERIAHGALPVQEAVEIARQIAEALEAAHEKGIVHRDLKPANITIAPGHIVKVLDFGLARLDDRIASDRSPTISVSDAPEGALRGTVGYMSPEQARGQRTDKRTDIWAFGCVLYEMLTGAPMVTGDTVSDRLAAILEREPDWTQLPAATPPALRRLLRRCLEKQPKRRLHDIADARVELDDLLASATTESFADRHTPRLSGRIAGLVAAILVFAVAASFVAGWFAKPRPAAMPTAAPVTRFAVQSSSDAPIITAFALSPDGSSLVYAAKESMGTSPHLFLRRLDRFDTDALPGTDSAGAPFFSPDGQWIGFFGIDGALRKLNATVKAASIVVCDCHARDVLGATWTNDNTIIFASVDHPLQRVSADGGDPQAVTTIDSGRHERDHHNPQMLADGRTLLYTVHETSGTGDVFRVAVQTLGSSDRRILVPQGFDARVVSTGHLVFANGGSLLAAPFDSGRVEITGPPVKLVDDVATVPASGVGNFAVSTRGSLAFLQQGRPLAARTLTWVDRAGVETALPFESHAYLICRLSPDGRRIAVGVAADAAAVRADIWTYEIGSDRPRQLTFGGHNVAPVWSPDGALVAYTSQHSNGSQLMLQRADSADAPETLVSSADPVFAGDWTPDGRLLYVDAPAKGSNHIVQITRGGQPQVLPLNTGQPAFSQLQSPAISPDGRWLAFVGVEVGHGEDGNIYIDSMQSPGRRQQITFEGGSHPLWRRDGRELVYRKGDAVYAIAVETRPAVVPGRPVLLFRGPYRRGAAGVPDYDIAPDGRFLFVKPGTEEIAPRSLNVVLNWTDELKQRVPTR